MRDKPEDDKDLKTPLGQQPDTNPAEASEADNSPATKEPTPEAPAYRVKDQFESLENITPSLGNPQLGSAQIPPPRLAVAGPGQTGNSIRREADLQDFFRNLDLIKIMRGVYRRFWFVLLCAFGMMLLLLPAAYQLRGGVSYSAESVIIYSKPEKKQIDAQGSSFLLRPLSQDTLVDMLLSPANISKLEEFTGFKPLKNSVAFDTQTKSDIVTLQLNNMPDEQTAIRAVNELAEIIINNNARYYHDLASTAHELYRTQREAAEKELAAAVAEVEAFQLKNQILELSTQWNNFFAAQAALLERLSISKVAYEGLITRIKEYEQRISSLPDEVLDESLEDNPLKRRISNAEAALLQARIQYAADNPKIMRQEREIEELRNMMQSGSFDATRERTYLKNPLKDQMEGELLKLRIEEEVVRGQTIDMEKELAELNTRFKDMPRQEKEYAALLEKRAMLDATYKTLKASEESARMTMASNLSDFQLLHPATAAERADASLLGRIVPLAGFIFGFFGGLVILLIIELLDAKIRTRQQLEKAYRAPCLASIVEIPNLAEYDAYTLLLPSLRELSDRLSIVLHGQKAKTFGFLSSLDGEGKSMLSFNLARYYSSLNNKVLYVSFDPRPNPCLPDSSDIGWRQMGIEDYLCDKAGLPEMLSTVHGVDVIRVQEMTPELLDLAKGSAMVRLWALLRENYDLILTDIPAVIDHPLAGTVGASQDALIYVLASSVSDRKLVDAGLEFMEDRKLSPCALIFNRVNPYYLEDIRQQRIIRNLSDYRSPLDRLKDRLHKPASTAAKLEQEERSVNPWLNESEGKDEPDEK